MSSSSTSQFAVLYSDHHGWLHGWLRRKLGCTHRAADVAHDTFLRVLGTRDSTDGIDEPRAYLVTTATRLIIDQKRREKIELAYLETISVLHAETHVYGPERVREAIDILVAIEALLDGLPQNVRHAFLLSRLEEMPQTDIAARLGVSVSMVKQYVARAMVHCYLVVHGTPKH